MNRCIIILPLLCLLVLPYSSDAEETSLSQLEFDDLGLVKALRAALVNHPAILGKRAHLAAKGYAVKSAKANRLPTLRTQWGWNALGDSNFLDGSLVSSAGSGENFSGVVRLNQPVWAFGKIDRAIRFATRDEEAENNDLRKIERRVLRDTALAYARIEGVRQKIEAAESNISKLATLRSRTARRRKAMLASDTDWQLVNVRLVQARAGLLRFRGELEVAKAELLELTGEEVPSHLPISRSQLPGIAGAGVTLESLTQRILSESAENLYQESLVSLAEQEEAQRRVAAMPTLALDASYSFLGAANTGNSDARVILEVNGALEGLGFSSYANVRASKASALAARRALEQSRNAIVREVATTYENRMMQQELSESLAQSVAAMTQIFESYLRQHEAGRKSWLEVLNLARELNTQELLRVEAMNDVLTLSLRLMALGGDLEAVANSGAIQ